MENKIKELEEKLLRKEQECEELKEENAKARMEICNQCGRRDDYNIPCKQIRDLDYDLQLEIEENDQLKQTVAEIKEIAEPYEMTIKKICGNCKKYNSNYGTCNKNINRYKPTSLKTVACEEFTYLDELVPNIIAINILQKISECEVENEN